MSNPAGDATDFYLVLNSGSSSIKFAGYRSQSLERCFHGQIDDRGDSGKPLLSVNDGNQDQEMPVERADDKENGLTVAPILDWVEQNAPGGRLAAIGHRVVHGGEKFREPALIDPEVLSAIQDCSRFAPLHNPSNLKGIRDCQSRYADLPQVAVFDTAFHQSLAPAEYMYPVPREWYRNHGVRRYGFHGTSHEYVCQQAEKALGLAADSGAFISLHLGNGCSAAAVANGKSVDTTMGLTPLEGMMMGTRSGDIDPGLPQFLCHELNQSIDEVTRALNKSSGLLGVSGITSDMRGIQEAMDSNKPQAALAFDMFCSRAAKAVAGMRVSLTRLDAVIFTGGIGEHSARVRERIVSLLPWLLPPLDSSANQHHGKDSGGVITAPDQRKKECCALVVATDEEKMIAHHIQSLMNSSGKE
ncbi:MAG: acetate/propionate family kinase [Ketobacteraceae bacterium]|nr:acetate/propionate family kinase [Ketobacteraceae bacterium]